MAKFILSNLHFNACNSQFCPSPHFFRRRSNRLKTSKVLLGASEELLEQKPHRHERFSRGFMNLKRLYNGKFPLLNSASGQGLLEYSVLLMLIAMVIFVTLQGLGETLETEYYAPLCSAVVNAGR